MNPKSPAAARQPSIHNDHSECAAVPARKMRRIAAIRIKAFKRLAGQLKKALGLKHSHALERLAQACGHAHYHEIHTVIASGSQRVQSASDIPATALIELWRSQLDFAFGVSVIDVLGANEVNASFQRLFVLSPDADEQAVANDPALSSITDPALSASNWFDREFRESLHRLLERRPRVRRSEP